MYGIAQIYVIAQIRKFTELQQFAFCVLGANFANPSLFYENKENFENLSIKYKGYTELRAIPFPLLSQKCGNLRNFICAFRAKRRNCAEIAFTKSKKRNLRERKNSAKLETLYILQQQSSLPDQLRDYSQGEGVLPHLQKET